MSELSLDVVWPRLVAVKHAGDLPAHNGAGVPQGALLSPIVFKQRLPHSLCAPKLSQHNMVTCDARHTGYKMHFSLRAPCLGMNYFPISLQILALQLLC